MNRTRCMGWSSTRPLAARFLNLCAPILVLACISASDAQIEVTPPYIHYQCQLTDTYETLLTPDTPLVITFSIYDMDTNGLEVWGPQEKTVALINGHFSVILGPTDKSGRSIDSIFGSGREQEETRWLQIEIEGMGAISPRQKILSAPFALVSAKGVPIGAIIPWLPPTTATNLEEASKAVPPGFVLCTQQLLSPRPRLPPIPELLDDRFLRGTEPGSVGTSAGNNTHEHLMSFRAEGNSDPFYTYVDGWSPPMSFSTAWHDCSTTTAPATSVPKHVNVLFIMRVE